MQLELCLLRGDKIQWMNWSAWELFAESTVLLWSIWPRNDKQSTAVNSSAFTCNHSVGEHCCSLSLVGDGILFHSIQLTSIIFQVVYNSINCDRKVLTSLKCSFEIIKLAQITEYNWIEVNELKWTESSCKNECKTWSRNSIDFLEYINNIFYFLSSLFGRIP